MIKAPKLLTEYVSTDSIVPVENTPVKSLPITIPCPNRSCGSDTGFTLYRDTSSVTGNAVWGFCTQCGATGDVIDLYMQKTGLLTPISVIRRLSEEGLVEVDSTIANNLALAYDFHRQVRSTVEEFWKKAQKNLKYLPTSNPVLQHCGLQQNHSFKFLGAANREQLNEAFNKTVVKTACTTLVVPFNDLPGRISMFRVYYMKNGLSHHVDIPTAYSENAGLFMLGSVRPGCDMVLAVDDPLFAFQMQNYCMLSGSIPWPIVAYTPDTNNWDTVVANKVVFWVDGYNIDTFKAAKNANNAYVSLSDNAIDRLKNMKSLSIKMWSSQVLSRAVPWTTALGTWLCSIKRDDAAVAINDLRLSSQQQQAVLADIADSASRIAVKGLFDSVGFSREVNVSGTDVVERDGCWYAITKEARSSSLVSDAVIRLTGTVGLGDAGNYYTGVVVRNNHKKTFYAPMGLSTSANRKWLEDFCLDNGMGCPEISPRWASKLFLLARAFSGELDHEAREGKVGWSRDLRMFNLPKRVVRAGIIEAEIGVPVAGYPCQRVTGKSLTTSSLRSLLKTTQSNAQFWALFACSMMNASAPFFGIRKKKIGAVGQSNFAYAFANAMDFCTVQVSKKNYNNQPMQHDVPLNMLFDHGSLTDLARWLNDPEEKNIIVSLDYLQATQVPDEDWVFVHTGNFDKLVNVPAVYDLIPHAIKFVQTCQHNVKSFMPDMFLLGFRSYIEKRFFGGSQVDFSVMDEAAKLISPQSPLGTTYGQAFLYGVFMLAQSGTVMIGRKLSNNSINVNDTSVTIPKAVVNRIVLDGCTKRVGESFLEEAAEFEADYAAWSISRKYWDSTFHRFQEENIF